MDTTKIITEEKIILDPKIRAKLSTQDEYGYNMIHELCNDRIICVLEILYDYVDATHLNTKANCGKTPLHLLMSKYRNNSVNDRKILDLLLSKKPDLNLKDYSGKSILEEAINNGNDDYCIKKLIENGADTDILFLDGKLRKSCETSIVVKVLIEIGNNKKEKEKEKIKKLEYDYESLKLQFEEQSKKFEELKKLLN
jgi:ankyrin repeat protein